MEKTVSSKKSKVLSLLVASTLTFGILSIPVTPANADGSTAFMTASLSGDAYLDSTSSLELDITPLAFGSDSYRYFDWSWADSVPGRYGGAGVGIDFFNSGTAHNFVLSIDNAVDVQLLSGVGNSVNCDKRNPTVVSGKNYFQAVCWTPYVVSPGNTFRIKVFNDTSRGPTWFKATLDDLTSGAHLEIGSINVGDRAFKQPLRFTQLKIGEIANAPSCNSVGISDTIFSSLRNNSKIISSYSSQSIGTCVNGVIVPNKYPLGGNVFKFGGVSPGNRNLEANATSQTGSTTSIRTKRDVKDVPRPANVYPGLSQTRFNGYFQDNPAFFSSDTANSDYKVVETLPELKLSDGQQPLFSNLWTGYFIPDVSGPWNFRMTSDDASYFWIGNDAVINFSQNIATANINLGQVHPAQTRTTTINLTKDKVYPFRIFYGNAMDVAVFKFEYFAPDSKGYESDLRSLVWHSNPSACTNWGIDYVLVGNLGYSKKNLPAQCGSKYVNDSSEAKEKPAKPAFSFVNFSGNKINISVNIGTGASRPDSIYLVAPKLGISENNRILGTIKDSIASWEIDLENIFSGVALPLKIVGVRDGVESDPLEGSFDIPAAASKLVGTSRVPMAPKKVSSRILGSSIFITAESTIKSGAVATRAYVFGSSIGVTKSKAIPGDIVGSKILLEIPLTQKMSGKKLLVTLFLANEIGESQPLQTIISVPGVPARTFAVAPKPKAPNTVYCTKGALTRTFAATACPPGWKKN